MRARDVTGYAFTRLVHSDWSTAPEKRWTAGARRTVSGWLVEEPKPVGCPQDFLHSLLSLPQPTLAGFDFPIGIPAAYARRVNVARFAEALDQFGAGKWLDFYRVCDTAAEISLHRPFYPRVSSKNVKQVHLLKGLGVGEVEMLRRSCERQTETRRAACPLFWTLGGNQVGKAAISGWRDVVQPARKSGALLWPFDDDLAALSRSGCLVICETYPAEAYGHVGVRFAPGPANRDRPIGAGLLLRC